MDYDLYARYPRLHPPERRRLLDRLRAELASGSAPPHETDFGPWAFLHGSERSEVRLVPRDPAWWSAAEGGDEEVPAGIDLVIPAGATPEHTRAACLWLFGVLSEDAEARVFDPQLGQTVTREDLDGIARRALALGAYLLDSHGRTRGHAHYDPESLARRPLPTTWWLLGALALLAVGWFVLTPKSC